MLLKIVNLGNNILLNLKKRLLPMLLSTVLTSPLSCIMLNLIQLNYGNKNNKIKKVSSIREKIIKDL